MAVASPSTNHSHLDPDNLRLCLTSRSSYGRKYRAFPTILRKAAHAWFKSLQPRSIYSFSQLSDLFQKHFVSSRSRRKNSVSLLNIVQEKNESLSCFLERFNAATLEIDNLDESVKYTAFLRGLRPTSKFRPKDPFASEKLTPLNAKPSQILHEIKDNKALKWPDKMKSRPNKMNKDLWCHFHNDHGHTTDNCGSLKRAIEVLIKRGQLRKFVALREGEQQTKSSMEEREDREENAVITIKAGNFDVKCVLIDNESSTEILFYDAFKKMNISTDRLQKMDALLYGFSNHPVTTEGIIALPVAIGTPPAQANFMLDFVVVKVPSAYNAILGQPALNQLQVVVSTYHLKMKFPMEHGIGEVKGDQTTARQCYLTSCGSKNKEALIIEDLREDTKMQRGEPVEDLSDDLTLCPNRVMAEHSARTE
ncbi:hypothetical protein RJ639_016473 [Escallonia herrerae]|uniref:Retrotransposon gag domain-containing protein n=1 Tax=Escallonia herrerae TaxID=1293975 RepID=A0AA88VCI9_9ASTE|nr:hypothetical protein RJ639_016473 [Escallonia herrerae]